MSQTNMVHHKETLYFILCVVMSIPIYLLATISIVGLIIIGVFILISLIMSALSIGSIRGNGVRLNSEQFPSEYARIVELSNEMGLTRVPDVFVIQSEGIMNAFATRFFGRNVVVLYSEVFDLARQKGEKELEFIIAHELAHVKRRHILKHWLILPSMWMPLIGEAYLRACEYTCDQHAAFYIQDGVAAKNALKLLAIGKNVYLEINEDAYLRQIEEESNPFVWISEKLSSHPNLPKRIQHIAQFMGMENAPNYRTNGVKAFLSILLAGVILFVIWMAIVFGIGYAITKFDLEQMFEDEYTDFDEYEYGETDLMNAIWLDDIYEIEAKIGQGVSLEEVDNDGDTAIYYTLYNDNIDALKLLLESGANPNVINDYGETPIIVAYQFDLFESAKMLVDYGADPYLKADDYSPSAWELALDHEDTMFIELFEQ